jgi:hypothetical protein
LRVGASLLLALMTAFNVAGCSCNTANTFDQRYCEAYSDTAAGPAAVVIGAAFFALTFLVWRFMWRRGGPVSGDDAVSTGEPPMNRAMDGAACTNLERVIANTTVSSRVLEGYDSRWVVELTFGRGEGADAYVTAWTTREAACRAALEELERRGHQSGASQYG